MKGRFVLFLLLALPACRCGRAPEAPPAEPSPPAAAGPCVDELERRSVEEASRIGSSPPKGAKLSRTVLYDLVFPITGEQFQAANRTAVLGVRVHARASTALPVRKVLVSTLGPPPSNYVLPGVFERYPVRKRQKDDPVARAFGESQQTLYLFLPMRFFRESAEVALEFADGTRMVLARFPNPSLERALPAFLGKERIPAEDGAKAPDPAWVVPAVTARYCLK